MHWTHFALTDRGRVRRRNEDSCLVLPEHQLFAVADGMGGHAAGDVASRLAVATLASAFPAPLAGASATVLGEQLRAAVRAAHDTIIAQGAATAGQRGMGTTLTVFAPLTTESAAVIAHVGDSRVYRMRHGELRQLTHDHTWVQQQIEAGMVTPVQARSHPWSSVLLRVLGGKNDTEADLYLVDAQPGDRFLLCTDGLSSVVADADLAAILMQDAPLDTLAMHLVQAALLRGGPDNVTVVLLEPHAPHL